MFFLFRSTLCIGLVTAALPAMPDLGHGVRPAGAPSLEALARYCRSNPVRCRLAVGTALEAVHEAGPAAQRALQTHADAGTVRS